jgi:IclR family acetate operon transcriptional repressor
MPQTASDARADGAPPVQAIERIVDLARLLAAEPKTLPEIAASLHVTKGSCSRLVSTLLRHAILIRDCERGTYALGPGFIALVQAWHDQTPLTSLASANMKRLSDRTGETVTLAVRVGTRRVVVRQIESQSMLRYSAMIDTTLPLHVGAAGRVMLAYMSTAQQREVIDAESHRGTVLSEVQFRELLEDLESARSAGYARGSRIPGAVGLSVPIFQGGEVVAALSIIGPSERFGEDREASLVEALRNEVTLIERRIFRMLATS